jgi:hypothetical protein
VVIKDAQVLGCYKEEMEAFASMKSEVPGTFRVKKCRSKGEDIKANGLLAGIRTPISIRQSIEFCQTFRIPPREKHTDYVTEK